MATFEVHFIEDSYAFNDRELRTSPGEKRLVFFIETDTAEHAYLSGVQAARKRSDKTFRLNYCGLRKENGK